MAKGEARLTESKIVRMTKEEVDMLTEKASNMGLNGSAYIRYLIRGDKSRHPAVVPLLYELNYEFKRIANNIDEIARRFNDKLYRREDLELIQGYMMELNGKMEDLRKGKSEIWQS